MQVDSFGARNPDYQGASHATETIVRFGRDAEQSDE